MRAEATNGTERQDGLRGDEDELYRRHHEQLLRLVERRLRVSRELAEDACSFAWLQLVRKQPGREHVMGWLYTVAKHEAFALLRGQQRATPVEDMPAVEAGSGPEDQVEARETLRVVAELRPQQQLVLLLQAQGYSYNEIVDRTGKTYTWVNRHLTEGRQAARRLERE